MSEITLFNFEGSQVRVSLDEKGEPWFVVKDVCVVLGHSNPSQMLSNNVDRDDISSAEVIDTLGRTQKASIINESGLYSLIMGSRLEGAKRFKRWVTAEVLPSIRKTGSYSKAPVPPTHAPYALKSEAESKAAIIRDTMEWMRGMMPSIKPEMANASVLQALTASGLVDEAAHQKLRGALTIEPEKAPMFTPTQLGDKLGGVKASTVNKMLEARGLQKKIGKRWEPTEQGQVYAGATAYQAENSKHQGYQIKWSAEILESLEQPLEALATKSKLLT